MPNRKCVFTESLAKKFTSFKRGRNDNEAECMVCPAGTYVSVANKGACDLEAHQDTKKHKSCIQSTSTSAKLDTFFMKPDSQTTDLTCAAEGTLAFHTVKHHQSFKSMDCTSKLQNKLYKDSNVAKRVSCARTKTEAIINSVLSPHSVNVAIEILGGISCFGLATDASNHGALKMFPILIQYFDFKSGGIQTKVIELKTTSNERADTISSYICDTLQKMGIHEKCISFAGDNTNTNFGGIGRKSGNNDFSHLKSRLNPNLVGVGCPAHVLHNCIQHGIDAGLAVDIESIVLKIFNYFSIYTVRTENLKEFCEFVEVQYKELLSHSKTRWLSLFPCITRLIEMFAPLKSYFLSQSGVPVIIKNFFKDELSEARLLFVETLMSVFHKHILSLEKEKNSVVEVTKILEKTMNVVEARRCQNFQSLKLKEMLAEKRDAGYDSECKKLESEISVVYESTVQYLKKWLTQYEEFSVFKWMDLKCVPQWEDVESTIIYINAKLHDRLKIDDVTCFDQFCNLKKFCIMNSAVDEGDQTLANEKWCKYFSESKSLECFSEFLKIAEYFFSIISHNANVERLFSMISCQWTKERNRLSVETIKGIACIQYNFKKFTCLNFYDYLLKNKKLLSEIHSSQKYLKSVENSDNNDKK